MLTDRRRYPFFVLRSVGIIHSLVISCGSALLLLSPAPLALLAVGCASGEATEMEILQVDPQRIPMGSQSLLTVTGNHLQGSVRIDLDSTNPPEVGRVIAWVGDWGPLPVVSARDPRTLQLVAPAELGLGVHAVTIQETLRGTTARLPNAVEVFGPEVDAGAGGAPADAAPSPTPAGTGNGSLDASVDADSDSGSLVPSGPDGPGVASPCAGASHGGLCWYLGTAGANCEQTCQAHGGYAPQTASFIGTADQGGSSAECAQILALVGEVRPVLAASRQDVGIGCHLWASEPEAFWLTAPAFAPTAGSGVARVLCGCNA